MKKVEIVPYDPQWEILFQGVAEELSKILAENFVSIFHIGSTSVPVLCAKPVIDIMPIVKNLNDVDLANARMEDLGYEVLGEYGIAGRRYFRKEKNGIRTHHIHIYEFNDLNNIFRHIAFRDYLRSRPDIRDEYASLKRQLAAAYPHDIESYMDGKNDFIKRYEKAGIELLLTKF